MASMKCSLRKETKNEIEKYIDSEFINETIKEIVLYLKTVHKVTIDESTFDSKDPNSKVTLKDAGKFKVYDYIYIKDFLEDISWEGSYVEDIEEMRNSCDFTGGSKFIPNKIPEDCKKIYKYEAKDIAAVVYEKTEINMEKKKGELYKAFKKRYTEEYLFNSVRWFQRTRDGKVYVDIYPEELTDDKKRSLLETIKTEIGNGFKTRWGSPVVSKVIDLEDKLLLDVFDKGCDLLCLENDLTADVVVPENSANEEMLQRLIIRNIVGATKLTKGINRLKVKVINSIDKNLDNLISLNIYKSVEHMNLFLEQARNMVFGYYKSLNLQGFKKNLVGKEDKINKIIRRIAVIENILYSLYIKENPKAPSLDDLMDFNECMPWICAKGLIWTSENIYIKNKAEDDIKEVILDSPANEYIEARKLKRHFYLHVGETNTGKTFASIERLKKAETGVYLAPLRLLALEIQDKLNSENIRCSLLTGEEEDIINHASHIASTVEKLMLENTYDVCVIDEAQMIADSQRGWAWTRAILGVLAEEIHICMATEAKDIILKLIKECNDTYEIIYHKRDTELVFEDKKFNLKKDVKKGDALVVFSKRKALAVSAELLNNNIKTSIIYGSLPYSTRKKQFERFLDGETEVIVCTDAIGMGINLPIKRIVFLESRKYDGVSHRKLKVNEIKQIAGRAGRKGIYNKGFVTATTDLNLIKSSLSARADKIEKCYIGVPDSLLEIDIDLVDALKTWSMISVKGYYQKSDVTTTIFLLNRLKKLNIKVSKEDLIKMATIPFEENNKTVIALWEEYCRAYSEGAVNLKKPVMKKSVSSKKELGELEDYYKCLELTYSFGKNFKMMVNNSYIAMEKEATANKINDILLTNLLDHERVCLQCGKKLAWDYPSERCRVCKEILDQERGDRFRPVFKGRRSYGFNKGRRKSYL